MQFHFRFYHGTTVPAFVRLIFLFVISSAAFAQTAPVITSISSPRQLVTLGQPLTLSVVATGTPAPTYQWKHSGRPISGATSPSYTIASASPTSDNGWYQVVVTNSSGSTTSAVVFVIVSLKLSQVLTAGNYAAAQTPVPDELSDVTNIAVGAGHWLALHQDSTVTAWGNNTSDQATVPKDLYNVVDIAACNYASYALKADGTVVAWGDNTWKQTSLPTGLTNVVSISAGQAHAIALKADGTVVAWGWNDSGQASPPSLANIVGISAGEDNSFAWRADGTAVSWGNNAFGQASIPAGLTNVIGIASGEEFAIALKSDGTVVGWGNGYTSGATVPVGLTNVAGIAAGLQHALTLKTDGSVMAWGSTYTGPALAPTGATNIVAIAAKDAYSILLRAVPERVPAAGPIYKFTTLAGLPNSTGSADGVGSEARFNYPAGIAVDDAGNVYVADYGGHTIRKVTPSGVVTTIAHMASPSAVAVDKAGNVYVADPGNAMIHKVAANGSIVAVAGTAGVQGSSDGAGSIAKFSVPSTIAADGGGNIYVMDTDVGALADFDGNNVVRKITPDAVVTTLAGTPHQYGSADGKGGTARFRTGYVFSGLAVGKTGEIYVADSGNNMIRKITAGGVVTTLVGKAGTSSEPQFIIPSPRFVAVDGSGNLFVTEDTGIVEITPNGIVTRVMDSSTSPARFRYPTGVAVDNAGNLYVADFHANAIYKGTPGTASDITPQLPSQTISSGSTVVLVANSSGSPPATFQWAKDGVSLAGATNATLVISGATGANAGNYVCSVTDSIGSYTSGGTNLIVSSTAVAGRIVNLSTRASAGTGAQTLILGTVIRSPAANMTQPVLFRAVGPSLSGLDVPGFLADPKLELVSGATKVTENDNWAGETQVTTVGSRVGAFPLSAASSKDAALYLPSISAGIYTMLVSGAGGSTGVALAEIYDATSPDGFSSVAPRLVNASARAQVGTGSGILIIGFVIGGETSKTLLIRAVGPSLATLGVTDFLADPQLQLFSGTTRLRQNDNWTADTTINSAAFAQVGARPFAPDSKDAALLVTLPPGVYTAQVSGVSSTTGVALVELYEVP